MEMEDIVPQEEVGEEDFSMNIPEVENEDSLDATPISQDKSEEDSGHVEKGKSIIRKIIKPLRTIKKIWEFSKRIFKEKEE